MCGSAPLSHLEHQDEEQQRRHDRVLLALLGQGVEVCEVVSRVLQEHLPLTFGCDGAAQLKPAHRRRQAQLADSHDSPHRQQVPEAPSDKTQDPSHQEVQHQSEEDDLQNGEQQTFKNTERSLGLLHGVRGYHEKKL